MALSITAAWDDARRFVAREAGLLVPVALTLLVVPGALVELAMPARVEGGTPAGPWVLALPILFLSTLLASLTISRLALGGGVSVGEALGHAARRLPVAIGASLILAFAAMLAFMPVAPLLPGQGGPPQMGGGAALLLMLYMLALLAAVFFVGIRLLLVNVVIVAEPVGVLPALRRSFALTKGHFPKLAGVMLLFAIGSLLIGGAASLAGGAVLIGLGKLLGLEAIGRLLLALLSGCVSAVLSVYFVTTLTMIYRRLTGPDLARLFD
ncbi:MULTISPECIES: hypothetical protein [Edaphosphingomonas]|uniref:Glycerophosphoryl diester phosphodiesterase membrane domain-containing protein n=2 Tax=Edaphosphingomonas TaxID=3423724 RepID=A0A2T4HQ55_9SPHN|nr:MULTISPECIES: hypothetical protein [Sphingomonas]OHT20536.1 hypothetical protein BHE75_02534 [Sphingomonas haloaromaticamans]PTD17886.1 hypothetical protein CV103_16160 [Sphingomonas fennica]